MKDYKFLVKFNLASYEVNIFFKVFSYLPPVFVMLWLSERVWGGTGRGCRSQRREKEREVGGGTQQ